MKSILLEFILNFLNLHWWIVVALGCFAFHPFRKKVLQPNSITKTLNWLAIIRLNRVDSWFGGLLSLIPIGLFEKFVGIEKSFGVVDFLTIIIMTLIVSSILERGDRDKASKKSASSPATTQRLSSDSAASKATKPIREINRYSTSNPSTSSSVSSSTREKLEELKSLLDDSLINEEDYEKKKNDLLSKM